MTLRTLCRPLLTSGFEVKNVTFQVISPSLCYPPDFPYCSPYSPSSFRQHRVSLCLWRAAWVAEIDITGLTRGSGPLARDSSPLSSNSVSPLREDRIIATAIDSRVSH